MVLIKWWSRYVICYNQVWLNYTVSLNLDLCVGYVKDNFYKLYFTSWQAYWLTYFQ